MSPFSLAFDTTIYVGTPTGVDGAGKASYATTPYKARVQQGEDVVKTRDGSKAGIAYTVYLKQQVGIDDRVWLPGEDPDTDPGRSPVTVHFSKGIGVNTTLCKVTL